MNLRFTTSFILTLLLVGCIFSVSPKTLHAETTLQGQINAKQQEIAEFDSKIERLQEEIAQVPEGTPGLTNGGWGLLRESTSAFGIFINTIFRPDVVVKNIEIAKQTKITELQSQLTEVTVSRDIAGCELNVLTMRESGASQSEIDSSDRACKDSVVTKGIEAVGQTQKNIKQLDEKVAALNGCSTGNISACSLELTAWLTSLFRDILARLVSLSDNLFNFLLTISIRDFPLYANLGAVSAAWSIVRDICNLFFIFILLYVAISTILNISGADTKKLLAKIIIAALLINFSMVFPKVVIDISNVFALQFYQTMGGSLDPTQPGSANITTKLVGGFLIDNSKVVKVSDSSIIWANLGQITLFLITSFVLLAGAGMLLYRTIILIFLIITSPLYFMGLAIPYLGAQTKNWLSQLISQSLYAPVMLFLMLVTIVFASGSNSLINQLSFASLQNQTLVVIVYSAIINVMMLSSFIAASKMGAAGAGVASSYGNRAKKWATGLAVGGAAGAGGFALTRTVGKTFSALGNSERMRTFEAKNPRIGGAIRQIVSRPGAGYEQAMKKKQEAKAERLKTFKTPEERATYIANLPEREAQKAYESMSARERVEMEEAAPTKHQPVYQNFRNNMSVEEREKTEKAKIDKEKQRKERASRQEAEDHIHTITTGQVRVAKVDAAGNKVKDKDGNTIYERNPDGTIKNRATPATAPEMDNAVEKLPASQAGGLASMMKFDTPADTTKSENILKKMSKSQFAKMMSSNENWTREQLNGIKGIIQRFDALGAPPAGTNPNIDLTNYAKSPGSPHKALLGL